MTSVIHSLQQELIDLRKEMRAKKDYIDDHPSPGYSVLHQYIRDLDKHKAREKDLVESINGLYELNYNRY